jgi:spore germination protein YaaH
MEIKDIGDIDQKYRDVMEFLIYSRIERGQLYATIVALLDALGMDEFEISLERMQNIGRTQYAAFLPTEIEGLVKIVKINKQGEEE